MPKIKPPVPSGGWPNGVSPKVIFEMFHAFKV
jgi:hypothetical protein